MVRPELLEPYSEAEIDVLEVGFLLLTQKDLIGGDKTEPAEMAMRLIATVRGLQAALVTEREKSKALSDIVYALDEYDPMLAVRIRTLADEIEEDEDTDASG